MGRQDLVIVGAGHLGCRIAEIWRGLYPKSDIFLKTRSIKADRDQLWTQLGYTPINPETESPPKTDLVVFCAPPTGNETYPQDVAQAAQDHWTQSETGTFVFTSSGGVFLENQGGTVAEDSEVKHSAYNDKILDAEKASLDQGGAVVRLGGLYELNRGAHNFWLTNKDSYPSAPHGLINLIHYQDAALCVVQLLEKPAKGQVFLASDGEPISRRAICEAARQHPDYASRALPRFEGAEDEIDGKRYDTQKLRDQLAWSPKFSTFDAYMATLHQDDPPCRLLADLSNK
eukprot:maker-scaffold145_size311916-snap-gene-0.15 protein:Tk09169 transcript:maker-scaffold145_size311916-snap-gene-0.15-mRNA-1 annotation:"hypothetical protein GUITHDRAFT_64569"